MRMFLRRDDVKLPSVKIAPPTDGAIIGIYNVCFYVYVAALQSLSCTFALFKERQNKGTVIVLLFVFVMCAMLNTQHKRPHMHDHVDWKSLCGSEKD